MKTLAQMWSLNRRRSPHLTAAVGGSSRLTYGEVTERASRLASALRRLGVGYQDRVSMLAMNRVEWFDYYAAAEMYGFVAATVNFRLAAPEIAFILADSDPRALIFESRYAQTIGPLRNQLAGIQHYICLDEPRPDWALSYESLLASGDPAGIDVTPAPEDIVRLLYTSGTTGRPKGAARSQYADLIGAQAAYTNMAFRPMSSCLISMPMFHLGGQVIAAAMHWGGGTVHLRAGFDALDTLRTIERERIEMTLMAPVMVQATLDVPDIEHYDLSSLSCICYSAAPMSVSVLKRALQTFGPIFYNIYAQTESGQGTVLYAQHHRLDGTEEDIQRLASVGTETQFVDIRIVDDDGRDCAPGQPGEILIRSEAAMSYYWNNPTATAETLRDGWVYTGDVGKFDAQRFIYLVDRKKDVIISGGENIYSREVEEALLSHPAVRDAAVIGVPDAKWGEVVKAIVVVEEGTRPSQPELLAHCAALLARYKLPRSMEFVAELPRLPSGKVHKVTLRQLYNARATI